MKEKLYRIKARMAMRLYQIRSFCTAKESNRKKDTIYRIVGKCFPAINSKQDYQSELDFKNQDSPNKMLNDHNRYFLREKKIHMTNKYMEMLKTISH